MSEDWMASTQVLADRIEYAVGTAIAVNLPDATERRRYALLQAAATIHAAAVHEQLRFTCHEAVQVAAAMLEQIESREVPK